MQIDQTRLKALFREMVDIYSPSGKEEEITAYLWEYLAARGLAVERQPVDENRCNLLISSGRTAPDTLFLGHIDTVPAFDIEHYEFEERENLCYGLGTADMKGGCAALIEAFICAAFNDCLPDNVMLALVVGEEEAGDGTQVLLGEYKFSRALVAEPTDLKPCFEHYGYVEMILRTFGYRRHAAMSDHDTNAIRAMLKFLLKLDNRVAQNEPSTVMNIRDLYSSESGFAVPDRCSASIDFHVPPDVNSGQYVRSLVQFVQKEISHGGESKHEIDFPTVSDGYRKNPDDNFPAILEKIFSVSNRPWYPDSFKSHSDANLLFDTGCCPVILGPGQLSKAHTRDEAVEMKQVTAASEIYLQLIAALGK